MKLLRCAALAAIVLAPLFVAAPARAQFGTLFSPVEAGAAPKTTSTSVTIYPLAVFIASNSGGSFSKYGGLISLDARFKQPTATNEFGLGAWYFYGGSDADVYEFHANAYANQQWGVQAGILGSSHASGNPFDVFLLYKTAPKNTAKPASIQLGLGAFIDPTGGGTSTDVTLFIQGSTMLTNRWTLNGTYWYVRDRGDFHRIGIGFGYHL